MTSQDNRVRSLAERATQGAVDPWEKAVRINHWVFENIKGQEFQGRLSPRRAKSPATCSGDCTRARRARRGHVPGRGHPVPGRDRPGLRAEKHGGFGYHMWNEVYVNQPMGRARPVLGPISRRRRPTSSCPIRASRASPRSRRSCRWSASAWASWRSSRSRCDSHTASRLIGRGPGPQACPVERIRSGTLAGSIGGS